MSKKQHAAIVFTDYKDFSKLSNEENIKVKKLNETIKEQVISKFDTLACNTWGDAFFICFNSCTDAAQCTLDIRHMLRTFNWAEAGFSKPLQTRIGIHFAEINLIDFNSGECEVAGNNISAGARIEPITEPDKIFCSKYFKMGLETSFDDRFALTPLGVRELAKNFGEMELFELNWQYEMQRRTPESTSRLSPQPEFTPSFPSLPPTDLEKSTFVKRGYTTILKFFQNGAQLALMQRKNLQINIETLTAKSFVAEMYIDGNCKHKMKIWVGGFYGGDSISCSEGTYIDMHSTSSMNDQLDLTIDNNELFFATLMGSSYNASENGIDLKKMTTEQAAQYFWNRFIQHASY